jgi:hypothetical protein
MESLTELFVITITLLTSFGLDWIKTKFNLEEIDSKILKILKPIQPIFVAAVGVGLSYLASLGINVIPTDQSLIEAAPLAGLISVTLREINIRLKAARDKKNGLPTAFKSR